VLKLAFTGRLAHTRNAGFETPEMSLPLEVLEGFRDWKEVARPERFELPTLRFEA
jgi:hypothetical protein